MVAGQIRPGARHQRLVALLRLPRYPGVQREPAGREEPVGARIFGPTQCGR
jgi:hypothetical protein